MSPELILSITAAIGGVGAFIKVVFPDVVKLIKSLAKRDEVKATTGVEHERIKLERHKAEREETGQHIAARFDCQDELGKVRADLARLEERHDIQVSLLTERLAESERLREEQIASLTSKLSRANQRISHLEEDRDQLRRAVEERDRENKRLREENARLLPQTRIG